jgi:hypothetical protein
MNRFVRMGLLLVLVMALFGTYTFVKAQNETRVPPPAIKHVLAGTYTNSCDASCPPMPLPPGFTPIDAPTTVACPGTTGTCRFEADENLQVGLPPASHVTLCFLVDGAFVNACYPAGEAPVDGAPIQVHTTQGISGVLHGMHTVQTVAGSDAGGSYSYYNFDYRINKP